MDCKSTTSIMSGIGEAAAALSIFKALVSVVSTIDEAVHFSKECQSLRVSCEVIQLILEKHKSLLDDSRTIQELQKSIESCQFYLQECRKRRFVRNPAFEVTFHRRIQKYKSGFDDWIVKAMFSVQVCNI